MNHRLTAFPLAALLLAGCAATPPLTETVPAAAPVEVGILAINDFHGNLEPPRRAVAIPGPGGESIQVPSGGAAWLATAIDSLREGQAHSLTVSAGDLTSASQLVSSLFLDEPTIGVMNRVGLDFNAVGNHEFDRGWRELLRLQQGGCERLAAREPCAVEPDFAGAEFRYLAANVTTESGETLFPGSALRRFGKGEEEVSVGIVGLTLEGTPGLVTPAGVAGLTFADEAATINAATAALKRAGADAVVVLIHEGAVTGGEPDPNGCVDPQGALLPILEALDPAVDLVVSGHTHRAYVCDWRSADGTKSILVTSAASQGTLVTDITLTIDPASGAVIAKRAVNVPVQSQPFRDIPLTGATTAFAPRKDIAEYVARYVAAAAEFATRPAGRLAARAPKLGPNGGPLGRLIADAQLAATREAGAQIALMNPGGIRADLDPQADGTIHFGDIYAVQPFDNTLVTMTLTGAQLAQLLASQVARETRPEILVPSEGLAFDIDLSRPAGQRLFNIRYRGAPLDPAADYRVTVNSFLASGGDGFDLFNQGTERTVGMGDLEALEAWLQADPPRRAPEAARVRDLTPPG